MNPTLRREKIITILNENIGTVSASALAEQLDVSRQVIVTDIALLRAQGNDILSTPRGYIVNSGLLTDKIFFKVVCVHDDELIKDEIYTIIDNGGRLIDVIVEHPIYGQLIGQLDISSRFEADDFLQKINNTSVSLLSKLTDGVHLHTITCADEATEMRIRETLCKKKILFSPDN